jgi:hypothetical protein
MTGRAQVESRSSRAGSALTDPLSTYHWVLHTEVTVDHPVSAVWPYFKDFFGWYTEYTCETVSGPPYRTGSGLLEGQVLKLTSSVDLPRAHSKEGAGPKHYLQKTLRVAHEREIVVVLSGSAYDFREYTAFYVWRLRSQANQTAVLVDTYGEGQFYRPLQEGRLSGYDDEFIRNWHRSWSEALLNLTKVLSANK